MGVATARTSERITLTTKDGRKVVRPIVDRHTSFFHVQDGVKFHSMFVPDLFVDAWNNGDPLPLTTVQWVGPIMCARLANCEF